MKHLSLTFLITLLGCSLTYAQTNKFHELADAIFLKIQSHQADSITQKFINKFVSLLAAKLEANRWEAYPPDMDTTAPELVLHSLYFRNHPFLKLKISRGRLDIFTQDRLSTTASLYDINVWLMFDKKQDAVTAFNRLTSWFRPLSVDVTIVRRNDKTIASFKAAKKEYFNNDIQFVLTKDELYAGKYKIFISQFIDPQLR